jgi:hypothetical protein
MIIKCEYCGKEIEKYGRQKVCIDNESCQSYRESTQPAHLENKNLPVYITKRENADRDIEDFPAKGLGGSLRYIHSKENAFDKLLPKKPKLHPGQRGNKGNTKTHAVTRTLTPQQEQEYKEIWSKVKPFKND